MHAVDIKNIINATYWVIRHQRLVRLLLREKPDPPQHRPPTSQPFPATALQIEATMDHKKQSTRNPVSLARKGIWESGFWKGPE